MTNWKDRFSDVTWYIMCSAAWLAFTLFLLVASSFLVQVLLKMWSAEGGLILP